MSPSPIHRRVTKMALSALPVATLLLFVNPLQATAAPPGNNGTVKIDGVAFDSHPNNQPHVGCIFEVDFYGFDQGDFNAKVTFTAQAPTGKGQELKTDMVPIGEDSNAGGGSEAGLDAQREYDLTAALVGQYPEHPKQGYHVKLTVNAPGSQGADTKHKVFWVRSCTTGNTTVSTGGTTGNTTVSTGGTTGNTGTNSNPVTPDTPAVGSNTVGSDVLGETLTRPDATRPGTAVMGETLAQTGGEPPAANLAATGSPIGMRLLLAVMALMLGSVAMYFGKRKPALTHG